VEDGPFATDAEPIPTAKIVDRRKRGSPLATIFLIVATFAALLSLPDPQFVLHPPHMGPDYWEIEIVLDGMTGCVLAFLLAVYCTSSWRIIIVSCFFGALLGPVGAAALQSAHDIRGALGGGALIVAFAVVVRLAERKPTDDAIASELPKPSA